MLLSAQLWGQSELGFPALLTHHPGRQGWRAGIGWVLGGMSSSLLRARGGHAAEPEAARPSLAQQRKLTGVPLSRDHT